MRQPIALSCGEPAGIGFEIAHKAYDALGRDIPFFLIADRGHSEGVGITHPSQALDADHLPILHHDFDGAATPGVPDPANAKGVIDVIARGVKLVQAGEASALCTLPIHKKALKDGANFAYPGHTEYLAALADTAHVVMMLACPDLRVVPVTIHIALEKVKSALSPDLLEETIRITDAALRRDFGLSAPRLMVAGLNPHAGEGGAMGREEITVITPVIEHLREDGIDVVGPRSADTMFHDAARASYDAAICMYCLLYTSPSPRDLSTSRMPSSA